MKEVKKQMEKRIKYLRKNLNLTQQQFAEKIGIKRNTLAQYETGRNEPIDAVLNLICREFNVNETWLRTGEGEIFKQYAKDEEITSFFNELLKEENESFKKRMILALSKFDEYDWIALEKMINKLK